MSLQHIVLRDFVIVRELDLDLSTGFTALTGETGAGKSILIDALQLVLGGRAESGVVREGATRAEICAEFDSSPDVLAWLDEEGFSDMASDETNVQFAQLFFVHRFQEQEVRLRGCDQLVQNPREKWAHRDQRKRCHLAMPPSNREVLGPDLRPVVGLPGHRLEERVGNGS